MSVDVILSRLDKVRKNGSNKWMACCSAHNDKSPSLSISERSDGWIGIHCFAGCEPSDILASIGLSMQDLFPEVDRHTFTNQAISDGSNPQKRYERKSNKRFDEDLRTLEQILILYQSGLEHGKKYTTKENQKYRDMYLQIQEMKAA